ncbi:MAG: CHAT domain-containing protein, partial [Saprospiraceae bacterium]|nr:CHAT domain-containing protein [Saprospiraceae bacterium]
GSKQKLAGDIFPVYEGGIEVALALFRLTGEEMYQEKAFRFAESNKSILLLESINESVAKSYSGIPDSLLDADKSLRTEIAFYEKSINEEKAQRDTTKIDYQKIKQWKNTLFDLKNEYQALIRVLEKDYPRYYELKYETKLATLKELQQNILSPTDAMLELFVGDRNIYVFAVTQNQVHIETISKPEDFEKQFEVFFYHTKNPQKSKKDRDPALALKGQYDFYADYLEGAMSTLPDGIKRLIIIPDDMFSFLPFEIFLSSPPQKMNKPRFSLEYHDYLIEQYSFTYNYSATLLQKSYAERKGPKAKHFLLAMAPRFLKNNQVASRDAERVCTINDIGNLGCTDEEIEQITDMVGGKALLDYDANMEAFNQIASEYKIIHLATHSCPDEENPMNSRIFLADGALTNYDLFNYKLSADMAVLSACNTGFGKFVKGEGVMPLSKGFIHAGVPSTIASTWPVEDCGTAEIMTLFYKYLKEGLAKDEALRQAKLQFMRESNNLFRQPYFWSPLIHVGNVEPIEVPYRTPTWVYWSAAGLLLLMGGTILWQRQRQTKLAA